MSIQYFKNPFGEALAKGGAMLGEGLAERGKKLKEEQKKQKFGTALQNAIQEATIDPVTGQPKQMELQDMLGILSNVAKETNDISQLGPLMQLVGPMLKEQEKDRGAAGELDQIVGRPPQDRSPIEDVKASQRTEPLPETNGDLSPLEGEGIQGISQPSESPTLGEPYSFPNEIEDSEGNTISQAQISKLINSKHERNRRLGESYQKQLATTQKSFLTEQGAIRKEDRASIRKFAEPYSDINNLENKVHRIQEVTDIVENESVSLDESFWRNAAQALLEDKDSVAFSQIIKKPGQQKMYALLRPFFGAKEIGGSNPSTREVLLTLATLPSEFKGKDANRYIAKTLMNEAEIALETSKEIDKLEGKGLPYGQFRQELAERVEPIRERKNLELAQMQQKQYAKAQTKGRVARRGYVFMMDPEGKPHEVLRDQIKGAQAAKWSLLNGK